MTPEDEEFERIMHEQKIRASAAQYQGDAITNEELRDKMLAFIETQDGSYDDEWYASPRDFAATILTDFAEYLGVEIVVPEYIPQVKKAVIDRNELFKELLPRILDLFELEYKKRTEGEP